MKQLANSHIDDTFYMREALKDAQMALERNEVPIGAVVVCNGKIIGRGYNFTEALQDVTAHAEMQAITAAANHLSAKYLAQCTLYVTLEPCAMCAAAIGWAQIARLVYGAADQKRGYKQFAPKVLHPKTEITAGVLENECKQILVNFFKEKRKKYGII
ncbi:MAG: nucleoside deaminase [Prevotellaceae bacterium]|jgi:tRNA(adenine34) deaminase|nr:nucleoside deaminase [Prevotellaceae bacterium]